MDGVRAIDDFFPQVFWICESYFASFTQRSYSHSGEGNGEMNTPKKGEGSKVQLRDRYGTISAEMILKLAEAEISVAGRPFRTIQCPRCGFKLMEVCGNLDVPVRFKCDKCKETGILNLAFFRTQRRKTKKDWNKK